MTTQELPPPLALFRMATGYYVSQAIYAVAKLGIADLLSDGPRRPDELAKAAGTDGDALRRVLLPLHRQSGCRHDTSVVALSESPRSQ